MKKGLLALLFFCGVQQTQAQILDRIRKKVEDKTAEKINEKIDDATSGKKKKKSSDNSNTSNTPANTDSTNQDANDTAGTASTVKDTTGKSDNATSVWRNYQFVPGDEILFFDEFRTDETGDFPARWDLLSGGADLAAINGEKGLMATGQYDNYVTPLITPAAYLPKECTIEFDIYVGAITKDLGNSWLYYKLFFSSNRIAEKRFSSSELSLEIRYGNTSGYVWDNNGSNNTFSIEKVDIGKPNSWHHVAITIKNGSFKMYYDDKRVLNLPRFPAALDAFAVGMEAVTDSNDPDFQKNGTKQIAAVKNLKIAKGGNTIYNRIVTDGKYVTNGILFDKNKAAIKSQSYGILASMAKLLQENGNWKFAVIGYTDSDGDEKSNITLSLNRAQAVKDALVKTYGIDASRLEVDGKGKANPVAPNTTDEGKATNRRVEFIQKK